MKWRAGYCRLELVQEAAGARLSHHTSQVQARRRICQVIDGPVKDYRIYILRLIRSLLVDIN